MTEPFDRQQVEAHSPVNGAADVARALQIELMAVEERLHGSLEELQPPFRQLAQAQRDTLGPMARAAIVLTAATAQPDTATLRAQRIDLATALEMLYLATQIHTRLVTVTPGDQGLDRSLVGSTILAGDFCFSRAAGFAVRTGNAAVVEIFAQALKQLSEARLRSTFAASAERRSDNRELFVSGLLAAGKLVGWQPALLELAPFVGVTLADLFEGDPDSELELPTAFWAWWAPLQAARWRWLVGWLKARSATADH